GRSVELPSRSIVGDVMGHLGGPIVHLHVFWEDGKVGCIGSQQFAIDSSLFELVPAGDGVAKLLFQLATALLILTLASVPKAGHSFGARSRLAIPVFIYLNLKEAHISLELIFVANLTALKQKLPG